MPPLLRLLASQPGLLADHAEAYVDLVVTEAGSASAAMRRRLWLTALSLCALVAGTVLAGVAVMLWAITVPLGDGRAWWLVATPALPLAGALWSWMASRRAPAAPPFGGVRQQLKFDMALLRETHAPTPP